MRRFLYPSSAATNQSEAIVKTGDGDEEGKEGKGKEGQCLN
jgi:hypothetical protein